MNNAQNAETLARSDMFDLKVLAGGAYEAPAGRDFPPHQHSSWEVVYYRKGHIRGSIGDILYEIEPGTLLLTPPNTVHAEFARTAYANYFINVDASQTHPWPRVCRDDSEGNIGRVCRAIVKECGMQDEKGDTLLLLLVQELDIYIKRAERRRQLNATEQVVIAVENLIQQRFGGAIKIQDLAQEVGASPASLRAYFARYRGYSPMDYLQTVRVNQALELLRGSTITLESVASLCGYDSASHLTRYVKRATGFSPGALRGKNG